MNHKQHNLLLPFLVSFALKALYSYFYNDLFGLAPGGDEVFYFEQAQRVAENLEWHRNIWVNFCGLLFYFFGPSVFVLKLFNCLLDSLAIFLAFNLCDEKKKNYLWVLCFLPPSFYLVSMIYKEALVSLLITLSFFLISRYRRFWWLFSLPSFYLLAKVRAPIALAIFIPAMIYTLNQRFKKFPPLKRLLLTLAPLLLLSFSISQVPFIEKHFIGDIKSKWQLLQNPELLKKRGEGSKGQVYQYLNQEKPLALKNLVVLPTRTLFSPSPLRAVKVYLDKGQWLPEVVLESLAINLFFYILFPFLIIGLFHKQTLFSFSLYSSYFLIFMVGAFTEITDGVETHRYKIAFFPALFILALMNFRKEGFSYKTKSVVWTWLTLITAFHILYFRSYLL